MQSELFQNADSAPQVIVAPKDDGLVTLYPHLLSGEEADHYLRDLSQSIAWQQRSITVYGKQHLQPRLVAWYGDAGVRYSYSGDTLVATGWTDTLLFIRERCQAISGVRFNSVLMNLYRDGQDAMGWHADNEPELGPEPVIASVSLGFARRFDLRHKTSRETRHVVLPHGSLLIMAGKTQQYWAHQIARSKKIHEPRINLTFRWINNN